MKTIRIISIFATLILATSVVLASSIRPESISPGGEKIYENKGESATVSHKVPDRFYGLYRFNGSSPMEIQFNSDGSGYLLAGGQSKKNFNWGMLVQNNQLVVTSYTNYSTNNTGSWDAHLVILKWDDGSYYSTFIFEHEGKLASPASYGNKMIKE